MRTIIIWALSLITLNINAQHMKTPKATVTGLFISTDQQDWNQVEAHFSNEVLLDYSSLSGNPASTQTPRQITSAWKSILPGFEHTHHQLGNFVVKTDGEKASVFCYGTASHYLADDGGNLWTVVGTYDFDLEMVNGSWKITSMKFNFKFQDGNTTLPQKAIDKLKQL